MKLLVVEDEVHLRFSLAAALARRGHRVEACGDGAEALALLEAARGAAGERFDLVLTDLRMPGLDGLALAREVRRRWPALPLVVMTAHGDREVLRDLLRLSLGYLEKPFAVAELLDAIEQAVAAPPTRIVPSAGEAPETFGRYVVERPLARGATSTVYRARQLDLDRLVALKVLDGVLDAAASRAEARALARLRHPHIPVVHETGVLEGAGFIAMELIEGESLYALLQRRGSLAQAEAVSLLLPLAEALLHVHACGLLHRDIKPGNVLIEPSGRAVLVDFGLAIPEQLAAFERDELQGTLLYMEPEYVLGRPQAPASDVYGLGMVLHEALSPPTWRPRISGRVGRDELRDLARLRPPTLGSHAAGRVCPRLAQLVDRALAPREERVGLRELAGGLRRWLLDQRRRAAAPVGALGEAAHD